MPRTAFPVHQSGLEPWYRIHNVVPSCGSCNNKKGWYRSDCTCGTCEWVWAVAIKNNWLREDFVIIVKPIVRSPG